MNPNPIPPKNPYVIIMVMLSVDNVDNTKDDEAKTLPITQAVLQPNLLENALTNGPALKYIPDSKLPTHATWA